MSGKPNSMLKNLASRARAKHRLSSYLSHDLGTERQDTETPNLNKSSDADNVGNAKSNLNPNPGPVRQGESNFSNVPTRTAKFIPRQSLARLKRHEQNGQERVQYVQYLQEMEARVVSQMVAQMKAEISRVYSASASAALQAQDEARIQKALPDLPAQGARDWQNAQNVMLRNDFMQRCDGLLTSHQVADVLGSQAKNRAATANHLKDKAKVLCLRLHGQDVYPAFQFDALAQKTYPEMAMLIQVLQRDYEPGWQIALWFTAKNAWLGGQEPLSVWRQSRQEVLVAAQAEMAAFDA